MIFKVLRRLFIMKKAIACMTAAVMTCAAAAPAFASQLTAWCYDDINVQVLKEAEAAYQEIDPDFSLEIVQMESGDLELRVTTAGISGDYSTLPDLFLFQDYFFQKDVENYPDVFYGLSGTDIDFSQFPEGKVVNSVVNDENYAVPFDNGIVISAYRTDFLEQAGYTIDDLTDITWDRFLEIARDVKEKTGLPMLSAKSGDPQLIYIMLGSMGGSFFDEDGNANLAGNEDLKRCCEMYIQMVEEGLLLETTDWEQYYASFANGNVVGVLNGCWVTGNIQNAADQSGLWDVTNIPKFDVDYGTNYSKNGGSSWSVSAASENIDLAVDFLKQTFAGEKSAPVYEKALTLGLVATYAPAADLDIYNQPSEFFSGDAVYAKFVDYSQYMPTAIIGAYYYDCITALGVATSNVILNGADLDAEIQGAQDTVDFNMAG